MKQIYISILLFINLFIHTLNCDAQTIEGQVDKVVQLQGRTIDKNGEKIQGVVVIASETNATSTGADGRFKLKVAQKTYTLTFRHLAYNQRVMTSAEVQPLANGHSLSDSIYDLGDIVLEETVNDIGTVTIKAQRTIVKVNDGKMIYDVESLSEGKAVSNAFEAIAQLPNVNSSGDRLNILGAMGTTVIINGKPSVMSEDQLSQYLKSIPVDRLEKIETSYNAPPQWHAVGAAINIVVKRDPDQLKGQLRANFMRSNRNYYDASGNLYVAGKRFSADVMLSYRDFTSHDKSIERHEHILQGTMHEVNNTSIFDAHGRAIAPYVSLGYKLHTNHSLNLSYYGDIMPYRKNTSRTQSNVFGDGAREDDYDGAFHGATLSYESNMANAGITYSYYGDRNNQMFKDDILDYATKINSTVNHFRAYADLSHKLPHEWNLAYGTRLSFTKNRSDQTSLQSSDAEMQTKGSLNEYNANIYINASRTFKKGINLSATLGGNYYAIEKYRKFNLLPSFTLTVPIVKNRHTLQYSFYTQRINPSYGMQKQFSSHNDAYHLEMGNPAIRPAIDYTSNLSYILKNRYVFTLIYNYVFDLILSQNYMSPDKLIMIRQPLNIRFAHALVFVAALPVTITKWWQMRGQVVLMGKSFRADDWHGISYDLSRFNIQVEWDNYFTISAKPQFQLTFHGYYTSFMLYGIYNISPRWYLSAGAQYTFAKNRATLNMSCNDIFQSNRAVFNSVLTGQKQHFEDKFYSRNISVLFTWKFGNYTGTRIRNSEMDASRTK